MRGLASMCRNFDRSKQKIQILGIALILLVLGTVSFLFWGGKKQVWFCDEIYTYESANGFEQELGRKLDGRYLFNSSYLGVYLVESRI